MNPLTKPLEWISSALNRLTTKIKGVIFGANNERLDFIIDSFYKLEPKQQKLAMITGCSMMGLLVIGAFFIYSHQVSALKQELVASIQALEKLHSLADQHRHEKQRFQRISQNIISKTQNLRSLKTFFEQVSKDVDATISTLNEKVIPLPESSIFAQNLEGVEVAVEIDNISLPKILKYVTALERSNNQLSVTHLTIRSRYETKLYFDTKISVRGHRSKQ